LTNAWNFQTDTVATSRTLYAKWSQVTHTVSAGSFSNGAVFPTTQNVIQGGVATFILIPSTENPVTVT
jgi:hypothetical protein